MKGFPEKVANRPEGKRQLKEARNILHRTIETGGARCQLRLAPSIRLLFILFLLVSALVAPASSSTNQVDVLKVDGIINPVVAEFIETNLAKAQKEETSVVIVQIDTPGGLDLSMRIIVKAMMNSKVPVVVYVSPTGARAASAGVFITMAADVAAMAPGTNIGAAHPVAMGGKKMDKEMSKKVENDAVAYIKSIADKHGRNAEWAEDAVRKSVAIPANEALSKKVIDLIATDLDELLEKLDGMEIEAVAGKIRLATKGATVRMINMGMRSRILNTLSNPNIAYILMMLGLAGLYFELSHPGSIFPGAIGAISLILAFYSFQTLPVNYAGILLILVAIIMFILEMKVSSFGLLTVGGVISMLLGSIMLFESPLPFLRLSWTVMIPTVLITAAFFALVATLAFKAYLRKPVAGARGLVGEISIPRERFLCTVRYGMHIARSSSSREKVSVFWRYRGCESRWRGRSHKSREDIAKDIAKYL
jgi:membrane-bound serine protease (ClpP class)